MEKKESAIHKIGRQALDTAIRHEIDGWPPYSIMGIYQPHRPETHPDSPQPQEKNNKWFLVFTVPVHLLSSPHKTALALSAPLGFFQRRFFLYILKNRLLYASSHAKKAAAQNPHKICSTYVFFLHSKHGKVNMRTNVVLPSVFLLRIAQPDFRPWILVSFRILKQTRSISSMRIAT